VERIPAPKSEDGAVLHQLAAATTNNQISKFRCNMSLKVEA
jgi:hypothetical protein